MSFFADNSIRGIYPDEVDEKLFERLGQAVSTFSSASSIAVGRDLRPSSKSLSKALTAGITLSGVKVYDIGVTSTPMLLFSAAHLKTNAGLQVTGGNAPENINGMKICSKDAAPFSENGSPSFEELLDNWPEKVPDSSGNVVQKNIQAEYIAQLLKYADGIKAMTLVVDAGGGVMGRCLPKLLAKLPCELIPLNFEESGDIAYSASLPFVERDFRELSEKVRETGADMGVAFDSDGDSCIFVDENGKVISPSLTSVLLAGEMYDGEDADGFTVVYDTELSGIVEGEVDRLDGKAIACRQGQSNIKNIMRENRAVFAADSSGRYYFRDFHYIEDAEMALIVMLGLVSKAQKTLSELVAAFPVYHSVKKTYFAVKNTSCLLKDIEKILSGKGEVIEKEDELIANLENSRIVINVNSEEKSLSLIIESLRLEVCEQELAELNVLITDG